MSEEEAIDSPPRRKDAKAFEQAPALNLLMRQVVDSAFAVHWALGPGLLETVYDKCLSYELESRGLRVQRQVAAPIRYRNLHIEGGLRMDMVVEQSIVVEIKSTDRLMPVHHAQLLTYLKLSGHQMGLLANFNVSHIKDGLKRVVLST